MIKRSKYVIDSLRQEPEEIRYRAALRLSFIIGFSLLLLSVAILLPLQLYFSSPDEDPAATAQNQNPNPQIGGATATGN